MTTAPKSPSKRISYHATAEALRIIAELRAAQCLSQSAAINSLIISADKSIAALSRVIDASYHYHDAKSWNEATDNARKVLSGDIS